MIRTLVAACAVLAAAAAHAQTPPREAYTHLPTMSGVKISPDGSRVAMLRPIEGTQAVVVYDLADLENPVRAVNAPEGLFLAGVTWGGDRYVLTQARETRKIQTIEGMRSITEAVLGSIDVETGEANVLLSRERVVTGSFGHIVSYLPNDPEHILLTGWQQTGVGNSGRFNLMLYEAELDSSRGRRLDAGGNGVKDIVADSRGNLIARVKHDPREGLYEITLDARGQDIAYAQEDAAVQPFNVIGALGSDIIAVIAYDEDGFGALHELDLKTGTLSRLAGAPAGHDIESTVTDPHTNEIVGYYYYDDYRQQKFLDSELEKYRAALDKALPDEHVAITSWSRDRSQFIIFAEGPGYSGSYSLFNAKTGKLDVIGFKRPMLPPEKVAHVEPFEYKARDGMTIPAYVTFPLNADPASGPFPTVILPHGGPESRDTAGFHWIAQFLASRGYAVIQPNFRGSSGYGASFRDAGFGDFGGAMIDDITDSTHAVIDAGIADPERICALGVSYGGYAALALGMRDDPALDCVASANGVTHLPMFANDRLAGEGLSEAGNYWELYMGARIADHARLEAWSPALNAAAFDEPVLLLHAEDDNTAPYMHSLAMSNALEDAGKQVDFVTLKGDDHYFASERSREEFAALVESFLAENLR